MEKLLFKRSSLLTLCVLVCGLVMACATSGIAQTRASVTDEVDIFVLNFFDQIQQRSFDNGVEYCGLIGYDENDQLVATPPAKGTADACQPDEDPEGLEIIANYHTHGSATHDADTEVASIDDLKADINEQTDGYIATPGGRVWFNDSEKEVSLLLCGVGCVKSDPRFKECQAFMPAESYTLDSLKSREENDTGEC